MNNYKLSQLCTIQKGTTGIKSAISGTYPLVVTAEKRLSSNDYQFDSEAVCVPLVSSTGHGHASINRIHYQNGKFALGTILAAIIPNDPDVLSAKYLYYYLSFMKDEILVPLMRGGLNVTLSLKALNELEIPVPSITEQNKVVKIAHQIEDVSNTINQELVLVDDLKHSLMSKLLDSSTNS